MQKRRIQYIFYDRAPYWPKKIDCYSTIVYFIYDLYRTKVLAEKPMLNFKCPRCGKKFSTNPEAAGRRTRCPKCSNPFRIPLPIDVPVSDIPIPLIEASEKKASQENESSSMDNLCEISHKNNPDKQIFKTFKEQFKTKK